MRQGVQRIEPDQVRLGMFIHGFDASWMSHPFWRSKFLLNDPCDLAVLKTCGIGVMIDPERGLDVAAEPIVAPRLTPARPLPAMRRPEPQPQTAAAARTDPEHDRAKRAMSHAKRAVRRMFDDVRVGRAVDAETVATVVDEISASVSRNARTLIGLTRLKNKDEYTYFHSVAVCALMVNLARWLKLDDGLVRDLGLAGLLHDVGKMAIPDPILNKPGKLTTDEFATVRNHPERGYEMLTMGNPDLPAAALDVCRHHHEKMDGTGYPFGLAAESISLAARMGAICDVYDALTSNRAYKAGWTPSQAVTAMDGWEGHFDRAVLFDFYRSIGIFPVGMLVRMRSNRLALTLDNGRRGTRQKVRVFYAIADAELIGPHDIELSDTLAGDQIVGRENVAAWPLGDWGSLRQRLLGTVNDALVDD